MPIVTLTSDWIQDDYYVATLKGKLLTACPSLNIVDISHKIPSFNTAKAAFVIKNSYHHFPKGSIHLVCVNTEPSAAESILAIEYDGHFFIGNDNGIFGLIFKDKPSAIIELLPLNNHEFSALGTFAGAACHIANNGGLDGLGTVRENINKSIPRRATIDRDVINGSVIYIDSYQNAITNITRELYDRIGNGRPFEIALQSNHYKLYRINKTYGETSTGELLVLFNSLDLLEVAINKGDAAGLLNLTIDSAIRVKFFDKAADMRK
jgi:S-adenosyl-L-methionine hydrolase (adenosine-forming)